MSHTRFWAATLLTTTCLSASALAVAIMIGPAAAASSNGTSQFQVADAQPNRDNAITEIVVTASRKRLENVQTTPIAITALSQRALERAHITNFVQVGDLAPNLQITRNTSATGTPAVYIRGFGDYSNDPAVDPHVAIFYDGVYLPAGAGTLFDTFDIGQIEVDAGPQGTLLGKNAPIGAVYITSARPNGKFGGELEGDYGSYNHFGLRGKLNFPIIADATGKSILAGRVSAAEKEGGNWVYNIANGKRDMGGENSKSGKLALAYTPDSAFEWDLVSTVELDRNPQPGAHPDDVPTVAGTSSSATQVSPLACLFLGPSACAPLPYGTTDSTYTTRERDDFVLVSSTMSYRFDPVTLTSVTGFNNYWQDDHVDDDGTPYVGSNAYDDRTRYDEETQELRVSSNKSGGWDFGGKLDWVAGAYYSNFNYGFSYDVGIGVAAVPPFALPVGVPNVRQEEIGSTQSQAVFLHTIYHFTDQWSGTFGVRQSWDHKNHAFEAPFTASYVSDSPGQWHNTSFEAGTSYQFDPHHMAYFRFAQGYEAGGFAGLAIGNEYNPELNNAYEIGFKGDWLNRHLRTNIDLFINDISQLQVESALPIAQPPFFLQETLNAGSATVEGFEGQFLAVPIENVTTHVNIGYLHPKYNQNQSTVCSNTAAPMDCSGLPFAYSPKWTINFGTDYVRDLPGNRGSLTFSGNWDYKSSLYTDDPPIPGSRQEGYGLVNLSLTYVDPTDKYAVEFYGANVLDRHYLTSFIDPNGVVSFDGQGEPATWGIRLTYKFGDQS